jgi:hypothetical protein
MRDVIIGEIHKVAQEQGKSLKPISDDLEILESGLDSLCFAILVARLEDIFGVDPFSGSDDMVFPTTFGELFKLYDGVPV